jgi:hypothetical protein
MQLIQEMMAKKAISGIVCTCLVVAAHAALAAAPALAPAAPMTPTADPGGGADAALVWHSRYAERYKREWGVDIVGVHPVSSGYMLRFAYRVLDPVKAAPLFDERAKPYLYDVATGARMAVPAMENIGELRQTPKPVADRTYFVIFGNPGRLVQPGGRVRIVIGKFEVSDLVVD